MARIVEHWRAHPEPWLMANWIGWGEPFCFGCNWLPPVPDGRVDSWQVANSWLDRAHLHDRVFGGADAPLNLVPLCHLCHDAMPASRSQEYGLKWVEERVRCGPAWQLYTDTRLHNVRPTRQTTLFRARVQFLEAMNSAATAAA
ncbi:hypothetical protein [Nocardia nova]|uniref:hypothetical protein n=1 Tax=Nocardia nova TaxID=37330 RepID=UPI002739EE1A|nr:hypothetical protein [Nocardia nova]